MKMSNKVYDILKYVTTIALPAITVLYVTLSGIWGWPYAEEVAGTLAGVTVFLGAMLGISTAQYNKQKEMAENA